MRNSPQPGNHCTNGTLVLIGFRRPFGPFIQQLRSASECLLALCCSPAHSSLSGSFSAKARIYLQEDDHCRDIGNKNKIHKKLETTQIYYKSRMISSIMHPSILIRKDI